MVRKKSRPRPMVSKDFSGQLLKPIELSVHWFVFSHTQKQRDAAIQEYQKALHRERMKKVALLVKHYELELNEDTNWAVFWNQLAFCLAIDFVPGFSDIYDDPIGQSGRPRKWPRAYLESLIDLFDDLKQGRNQSDFALCLEHLLATDESLAGARNATAARRKARTLQNRISRIRSERRRRALARTGKS